MPHKKYTPKVLCLIFNVFLFNLAKFQPAHFLFVQQINDLGNSLEDLTSSSVSRVPEFKAVSNSVFSEFSFSMSDSSCCISCLSLKVSLRTFSFSLTGLVRQGFSSLPVYAVVPLLLFCSCTGCNYRGSLSPRHPPRKRTLGPPLYP